MYIGSRVSYQYDCLVCTLRDWLAYTNEAHSAKMASGTTDRIRSRAKQRSPAEGPSLPQEVWEMI